MRRGKAFTLAELLTVLAIMAILAGLLFPVFLSVKAAAKGSKCLSNMKQASIATALYMDDYDQIFMPVNHRPGFPPNPRLDRTWVQLILPYARGSFDIFMCPGDDSQRDSTDTAFDQDLVPGDIYASYYTASMHVNMGYNYLYLSPIVLKQGRFVSEPKSLMAVNDPSSTLLFVDSIWDRSQDGTPKDGGSWIVVPPCRYATNGKIDYDTFAAGNVFSPTIGWKIDQPNSPHQYGNAWPWHLGKISVARVDGSVKSISVPVLTAGCNVKDGWQGLINDPDNYIWDIR